MKDQSSCGSCWAFSAVGALESAYALKGNTLTTFSEQQLVDCSWGFGNEGCNGGWMDQAFNYLKGKDICKTDDFKAYNARDNNACDESKCTSGIRVVGISGVPAGNADALDAALSHGPVSVAVDASNWSQYRGGVFSNCASNLNHGVLLVGATADFWIIKNSWGSRWGENGFMNIKRGDTCGIAQAASYPILN